MKCSKCGNEFEGNFCPNCGTPVNEQPPQPPQPVQPQIQQQPTYQNPAVPQKQKKKGCLAGGFVILAFIIIIVAIAQSFSGGSKMANTTASQAESKNTVVSSTVSKSEEDKSEKVDYKTLYKDYEDNAISADKKYKDKKLILTGKIANIDRDIAQNPYITFNIDEYGAKSIKMSFTNDDTVAKLKKGQTVTVSGTCGGTFASTIVTLSDCDIVK